MEPFAKNNGGKKGLTDAFPSKDHSTNLLPFVEVTDQQNPTIFNLVPTLLELLNPLNEITNPNPLAPHPQSHKSHQPITNHACMHAWRKH